MYLINFRVYGEKSARQNRQIKVPFPLTTGLLH